MYLLVSTQLPGASLQEMDGSTDRINLLTGYYYENVKFLENVL